MNEIKPNWVIAQQISRRHTLISLGITLPLILTLLLIAFTVLHLLGVPDSGKVLKSFFQAHQRIMWSTILFIHLGPVNYYAIIKVFKGTFRTFDLKVFQKSTR